VLLHGLASTPKEFGLLLHPLRREGIAVHTPEVRGYSHGSLARPAQWRDWVDAASEAIHACVGSDTPFVLGGLCTGAILALAVAARRPPPSLRGLALMSPIFAYDGWALPWWYRLRVLAYRLGLLDHFSMAERPPYGLKNERLRQWVRQQMADEASTLVGPPRVRLQVVRESERMSCEARG
jgi:carboxylesterase